jgi:hypothetical protein
MTVADVSVVIAAYDAAACIGRAIRSLRGQTRAPREIIVVDDGSRDGTADVVRSFGGDLIVVRQENRGPGAARNAGVRRARSALVAFLDADDEYLPHTIATLERTMAEFPQAEVASGATLLVWRGDTLRTPAEDAVLGGTRRAGLLPDFFEAARRHPFVVCTNSVVVRRRAFETVGGFREDVRCGEDLDLWGRLAGRYPWAFVDEPLDVYHHSQANGSLSTSSLRTPLAEQPTDKFMPEERMRAQVRPALWGSYRRYRRDLLCAAARKSLANAQPGRARRVLAGIAPAPLSANWIATWLLARAPFARSALRAYHVARSAEGRRPSTTAPTVAVTPGASQAGDARASPATPASASSVRRTSSSSE